MFIVKGQGPPPHVTSPANQTSPCWMAGCSQSARGSVGAVEQRRALSPLRAALCRAGRAVGAAPGREPRVVENVRDVTSADKGRATDVACLDLSEAFGTVPPQHPSL